MNTNILPFNKWRSSPSHTSPRFSGSSSLWEKFCFLLCAWKSSIYILGLEAEKRKWRNNKILGEIIRSATTYLLSKVSTGTVNSLPLHACLSPAPSYRGPLPRLFTSLFAKHPGCVYYYHPLGRFLISPVISSLSGLCNELSSQYLIFFLFLWAWNTRPG